MTSVLKRTRVTDTETGKKTGIVVRIWNETLANMLMILGTLSPFIFIGLIELFANRFHPGDFGIHVTLISSAFTAFIAIGVLICSPPAGELRKSKNSKILILLAIWSFILYTWIFCSFKFFSVMKRNRFEAAPTLIIFVGILVSVVGMSGRLGCTEEAALAEYNENLDLCEKVLEKITNENPSISENYVHEKAKKHMLAEKSKSWAYYMTRVTNKIAGRHSEENVDKKEQDSKISYDVISDDIVIISEKRAYSDDRKTKIEDIFFNSSEVKWTCHGGTWKQQFKDLMSVASVGEPTPANWTIHVLTWPWRLTA